MHLTNQLPCATRPRPDELLSSWLVRLAHAHLIKVHTFGKLIFPTPNIWNRDVDKIAHPEVLAILAARTPASAEQVFATTLRSYEGRLYLRHNVNGNTPWILPLGVYHRTRRRNGVLFCPSCLRKDGETPYFRKHWRLALSVACPTCEVRLEDQCPQCGEPVAFFRAEMGQKSTLPGRSFTICHRCLFDWCDTPAVPAPAALVQWQRECDRILAEGWREGIFHPHLYFQVLHHLARVLFSCQHRTESLQQCVVEQAGVELPPSYFQLAKGRLPFEMLPLELRAALLQQASWLLEEWPHRFIEQARKGKLTSTPLLRDMSEVPFWYHTVVMNNFYVSNLNRRFNAHYQGRY